jgi:UPF0755 protein
MQKTTSWFRNCFGNLPRLGRTSKLDGVKRKLGMFKKNHPLLGGGIIISIVISFLVLGYCIWCLTPVESGGKRQQAIEIRLGAPAREVGKLLQTQGMVHSSLAFEIYVRLSPHNRMAKAGWYQINSGMSLPRIVRELHRGTPQEIRLTIPEGLTIKEMAQLLAKKRLVNEKRFLGRIADRDFVNGILGDDFQIKSTAEGYLFPDTYNFILPVTEDEIITTMLTRFKEVYNQNFSKIPAAQRKSVIIIASLVEKEAKKADERSIIAGVFYKRLRLGIPLGSCATIQYALGTHKQKIYDKDLLVDSPYNTYQHYGLPPGPIANPGLASLKAAANPDRTSYLYFVAKPDGTHVFSNTLQEHNHAKQAIERNLKFRGMVSN